MIADIHQTDLIAQALQASWIGTFEQLLEFVQAENNQAKVEKIINLRGGTEIDAWKMVIAAHNYKRL